MKSVKVTVSEAANLTCPYTGLPLEVHMNVAPGSITFSAPDAFCIQEPVESYEVLMDRLSMRNGIAGVVKGNEMMKDAYTGEILQIRELPGGRVAVKGGFNPRAAKESVEEFAYYASMRGGNATRQKPGSPGAVTKGREEREHAPLNAHDGPSDELKEHCEKELVNAGMKGPTFVSMFSRKGKGKK